MSGEKLEVWIDADFVGMAKVGVLSHDRGNVRFQYDKGWLSHPRRFDIDPDLSLDGATFHPNPEVGNFGIFLDSSPDRWGQTLMKRREALEAKDENRPPRTLYAWDFLVGVQDLTRQGALRFKHEGSETFLSAHKLPAPPITLLRELESEAKALTGKRIDDVDNRPSLKSALETAALYELEVPRAEEIIEEVESAVKGWKAVAKRAGIANAEIELMEPAFLQYDLSTRRPRP